MNHTTLLAVNLITPGAPPPILWGPPGVGKTTMIGQIAATMNAHFECFIASIHEPADIGGLSMPDGKGGIALVPPSYALRANAEAFSIILYDEISCAVPAIQAACLRVFHEKVVGDLHLHDGVKLIAAANPVEEAAGGWDLAPPMANRFMHILIPAPSVDGWTSYMAAGCNGMTDFELPKFDSEKWQRGFERWTAIMGGFLRARPVMMIEDLTNVYGRFPMAYATPRTWEGTVRMLATTEMMEPEDKELLQLDIATAMVGEGAATELIGFARDADLPDPEEILSKREKFQHDDNRPDRTMVVGLAVAQAATRKTGFKPKEYSERWVSAWEIIGELIEHGLDKGIIPAKILAQRDNRADSELTNRRCRDVILKLTPVLKEIGVL